MDQNRGTRDTNAHPTIKVVADADTAPARGLVAQSLGKRYKKRPVVSDVSMAIQRGEAVGLLGPNGAGKTTCFT